MKLLVYSSLFPNEAQPQHGIFVETRLRRILAAGGASARVIAPVPWFPFRGSLFGRYGEFARVPRHERRGEVEIDHPRYPVIPAIGMNMAPALMACATRRLVARHIADGAELIDAHYFYPDGVAAARLGAALERPVAITARGSDVNLIADHAGPRRQILEAADRAAAIIAVSEALKRRMVEIGIDGARITVLRNGVDTGLFVPTDRAQARAALGLTRPALIAVGNLLQSKGQDVAIRALALLDDMELLIVGAGPDAAAFHRLAGQVGVEDRVRFLGRKPQAELPFYYSAAEVSLLASAREGWPNVLLESMACGTPAVASDVGGVGEIITAPEAGRIMSERTPEALAAAVRELRDAAPPPDAVRAHAARFGWDEIARDQRAIYQRVIEGAAGR